MLQRRPSLLRLSLAFMVLVIPVFGQNLRQAMADYEAGHLDEAERALKAIVRDKPDSFDGNFYLGLVYFKSKRWDAARGPLEAAVKLSPGNGQALKALGVVTGNAGHVAEAIPPLTQACRINPDDPETCYFLARMLYALGRYQTAIEPFEKALAAARPEMVSAVHRFVALNLSALGRDKDAERHFREALTLGPRKPPPNEDPRLDYGVFLFRQGRGQEALKPLQEAADEPNAAPRAHLELGRALLEQRKPDAAAAQLERTVAVDPANSDARLLLGRAYLLLGRTEEGERELRLGEEGWSKQHPDSSIVK
jgi:Tfp pilus assembly protein PilF